ncbi:MAG: hypothetical protein AABW61_00595 [Candidatus Aenigmatarchaeota archaeon]
MLYTQSLGIGLIPIEEQQDQIYELVDRIKQEFDLTFATERGISIPHLTLFQGVYQDESQVVNTISSTSISLPRHQPVKGLTIWAQKILFLDCEKTPDLYQAHNRVFERLFPLCEGKSADPQNFIGITSGQQKSFNETGYPFSLQEYLPHFTLSHLKDPTLYIQPTTQQRLNDLLSISPIRKGIDFEKLIVYRVGLLGACKEFVYQTPL